MAAWKADVEAVGIEQAVMIVPRQRHPRAGSTRTRARGGADRGQLGEPSRSAARRCAVGDRVIARRNDRDLDIDNGTRGTVARSTTSSGR